MGGRRQAISGHSSTGMLERDARPTIARKTDALTIGERGAESGRTRKRGVEKGLVDGRRLELPTSALRTLVVGDDKILSDKE